MCAQLVVSLARLGRDARLGLAVNGWIELIDDGYTRAQRAPPLLQAVAVDVPESSVTVAVPPQVMPHPLPASANKHPLLRRWDPREPAGTRDVLALPPRAAILRRAGCRQ